MVNLSTSEEETLVQVFGPPKIAKRLTTMAREIYVK